MVNCQDESIKTRIQHDRSLVNTNNVRFSRLERSRSRDASQSRLGETRRSNSKKKIFGCESVVSEVRPVTNGSRVEMVSSIYQELGQLQGQERRHPMSPSGNLQKVCFSTNCPGLKIGRSSFIRANSYLWYFKENSKTAFKASLDCIESGF